MWNCQAGGLAEGSVCWRRSPDSVADDGGGRRLGGNPVVVLSGTTDGGPRGMGALERIREYYSGMKTIAFPGKKCDV